MAHLMVQLSAKLDLGMVLFGIAAVLRALRK